MEKRLTTDHHPRGNLLGLAARPSCLVDSQGVEEECIQSRARSMGTAAAGGGYGGCGWLPWLGLCFWAAGAAAARGKHWVDGGAKGSGPRRSGTCTFCVSFPSCACFSLRAELDSVGTR